MVKGFCDFVYQKTRKKIIQTKKKDNSNPIP